MVEPDSPTQPRPDDAGDPVGEREPVTRAESAESVVVATQRMPTPAESALQAEPPPATVPLREPADVPPPREAPLAPAPAGLAPSVDAAPPAEPALGASEEPPTQAGPARATPEEPPPQPSPTRAEPAASGSAPLAGASVMTARIDRNPQVELARGAYDPAAVLEAFEAVERSARLPDLVKLAVRVLSPAIDGRRLGEGESAVKVAADLGLAAADAETPLGNVVDALDGGSRGTALAASTRALAGALASRVLAERAKSEPSSSAPGHRVADDVLWLATATPFDPTACLDRAFGADADGVYRALGQRLEAHARGTGESLSRAAALVGYATLAGATSPAAEAAIASLATATREPLLLRVLGRGVEPSRQAVLVGRVAAAPRGLVATTLLAVSGVLLVLRTVELLARLVLRHRSPAEAVVAEGTVRIHARTEVLGRLLREREHVIARGGLVRVVREVRYPRAAFYAGLLALSAGSYVGVRAFVDGMRAASPSLLATGLVIVALGIVTDFVLGSVLPGMKGRCRVTFVPRVGRPVCLTDVDARRADDVLARLSRTN